MRTVISSQTIKAVRERSGGVCEVCHQRPVHGPPHHEPPKGMGGTRRAYTAAMLKDLCLRCHAARHGQVVILDDDGDY